MSVRSISLVRLLPGLAVFLSLVAAPLMAMPAQQAGSDRFLGAEVKKSSGAGLVLMVSLQRAR